MTLCDAQGVANARSTEKAMESEDKDGKPASEETNPQTGVDAARLETFNQYGGLLFSVAYRMRMESRQ
jgi:hypothetical protein